MNYAEVQIQIAALLAASICWELTGALRRAKLHGLERRSHTHYY